MQRDACETTIREKIEWCRIWVPDSDETEGKLPRVLLVGDSIVMGYGPEVGKRLKGTASVAWMGTSRFPTDPAFRDEVLLVLRHTSFALVHFNNGLHGFANADSAYEEALPRVVAEFRAASAGAEWILANSTAMRQADRLAEWHPHTDRIRFRNKVVRALAEKEGLPLTDLFSVTENRPDLYVSDGTHFTEPGSVALAARVAESIERALLKAAP